MILKGLGGKEMKKEEKKPPKKKEPNKFMKAYKEC